MMSDRGRMNMIVPPNLTSAVSSPNASARDNIAAGVGYLLFRAARWGQKTVTDEKNVKTITVERGDSLYSIARRVGSTEDILRKMNARASVFPLKPGTSLSYAPSKTVRAITGWESLDPQGAYRLYNVNPRTDYANKVRFMLDVIKRNRILN